MSEDMKDGELRRGAETAAQARVNGENQQAANKERQAKGVQGRAENTQGSLEAPEEGAGKKEKKGFFKKRENPRDEKIEELMGRVKRQTAELENFRRRTEKEKSTTYEVSARDVIERTFPAIDDFERGLVTIPEEEKGSPLVEGMEKTYKRFRKTLEEADTKAIEATDQEFDPSFRSAVMHADDENLGENMVVEESQKGYLYRDSVVRHNMIKIANQYWPLTKFI